MKPTHYVIMGVSGAGKTTVATELGARLGLGIAEADDFHPETNITTMSARIPLTDRDRWPWLQAIARHMAEVPHGLVVPCSALKRSYRDILRNGQKYNLRFVHIDAPTQLTAQRLRARTGHFMPPTLLASQCADLEPLGRDEDGIVVANTGAVDETVAHIISWLRATEKTPPQTNICL